MSHAPVAGIPMSLVLVGACLAAAANPPFIVYGGSRASTEVIETSKGGVPVDQGIAWEGVKVYLSIMGDLVAVDAGTGKFLWCRFVGAFWNEVGFQEVEVGPGRKAWAVALKPGPGATRGKDLVQYHDLRTGREIPAPREEPAGVPVASRPLWRGDAAPVDAASGVIVDTPRDWAAARERMFGKGQEGVPELGPVDFSKEVVLAYPGDVGCAGAWEDGRRLLVRLSQGGMVQTCGGGDRAAPRPVCTLLVLPRHAKGIYVFEKNVQGYIAGPPIWQEAFRLELPKP